MEIRSAEEFREVFLTGDIKIHCETVAERYEAVCALHQMGFEIQDILFDNTQFPHCKNPGYSDGRVIAYGYDGEEFEHIDFADFMDLYASEKNLCDDISDVEFQAILSG